MQILVCADSHSGNYDLPLIPMVLMLVLSALLWLRIDPTEQLIPET